MNIEQTPNQHHQIPSRTKITLLILAAILVAVAAGATYYSSNSKTKTGSKANTPSVKPDRDYSAVETFKLDGSKAGSGISFDRPKAFDKQSVTADKTQAGFSDIGTKLSNGIQGVLSVTTAPGGISDQSKLQTLKGSLSDPSKSEYQSAIAPLKQFVTARFNPAYDLTFASAHQVNTANLQGNAWAISFSAKPKAEIKPLPGLKANPPQNYKGEAVIIFGKNAVYYFDVYATDKNWDGNGSVWPKVFNSLKVDQ